MRAKVRVTLAVCAAWTLAGLIWGAQTSLGSTLQGAQPIGVGPAVKGALGQTLPWIPVTLAVIALTIRFPLDRARWKRHALVHLVAAVALAFLANVLVVLGYWLQIGKFAGFGALARAGALWATIHFHYALLIYAAILGATQAALDYRRTRARELELAKVEGQLARARLEALNAQIRPHFLFNTLHTIGQLWRSGRSDEADAVLDGLGALFHKVQSHTSRIEIPLGDELQFVREYFAIEQARFPDRLRPTIRASDAALAQLVPPLVLQPIVENAVRHGVSALSTAGVIEVSATLEGDLLRLTVTDDGPGMGNGSSRPGWGTGLRNTRERIAQLYGERAAMRIAAAPGGGTIVTLDLPISGRRALGGNGASPNGARANGGDD